MNIHCIQINNYAATKLHQAFKIDLAKAEKITTLAQGALVAVAAYFIFPEPIGFILSAASIISSLILAQDKMEIQTDSISETQRTREIERSEEIPSFSLKNRYKIQSAAQESLVKEGLHTSSFSWRNRVKESFVPEESISPIWRNSYLADDDTRVLSSRNLQPSVHSHRAQSDSPLQKPHLHEPAGVRKLAGDFLQDPCRETVGSRG